MIKKIVISIITGILIIVISLFYILKKHEPQISSVFDIIPLDAGVVIDIRNYYEFRENLNTKNVLWNNLSQLDFLHEIEKENLTADSILKLIPALSANKELQILISLHPTGVNNYSTVYYVPIEKPSAYKKIIEIIQNKPGTDITERTYDGCSLSDINLSGNKSKYSISLVKGILVISSSSILVENVIRHSKSTESILQNNGLAKLIKSAGKNYPANAYYQFNFLERICKNITRINHLNLKFLGRFGGWTELDLNLKPDVFILNGFTEKGRDSLAYMTVFNNQKAQRFEIFSKIPSVASNFLLLGIDNLESYQNNLQNCNRYFGISAGANILSDSIASQPILKFIEQLKGNFDNEAGIVTTPGYTDTLTQENTALIKIKSSDDAENSLKDLITTISDKNGKQPESYIREIALDSETTFNVYQLPAKNIPSQIFGSIADVDSFSYCFVFDNYIIFGNSLVSLKNYIMYCFLNNTMNTSLEFNSLSENCSSSCNLFYYVKPGSYFNESNLLFNTEITKMLTSKPDILLKTGAIVFQLSYSKGLIYNNLVIQYAGKPNSDTPKTIWESQLDGKITAKPVLVKNFTTNENEIFVTDNKYNIYLINASGRILWKNLLNEPIISDIYQIDYYRNRKLQYLFNTRTKIYLVDRTGNLVENYPVTLPSAATAGLAVLDYDKNRNYRIFIPTEDRKVLLFDKQGKQQKGWNFGKTENIVTYPVQYFKKGKTDYLVFSDNYRIYILNRKGETRVKPEHNLFLSRQNPVYFIPGKKNSGERFVFSDTTGLVHAIDTKGKITDLDFGKYGALHFFDIIDVNADNKPNFIFTENNSIKVFNEKKELISSFETQENINIRPLFYEITYKRYKIGIVSSSDEKIYLYDINGNLHNGFPLTGATQFSIGLLNNTENRFNLIVGTRKNFLYNYSVQ